MVDCPELKAYLAWLTLVVGKIQINTKHNIISVKRLFASQLFENNLKDSNIYAPMPLFLYAIVILYLIY